MNRQLGVPKEKKELIVTLKNNKKRTGKSKKGVFSDRNSIESMLKPADQGAAVTLEVLF